MTNLSTYDHDPKMGEPWKSVKYRKFITRTENCYCGKSLVEQDGMGLHHHRNSGGQKHPKDSLLTKCCPTCHESYHDAPESFYRRFGTSKDGVSRDCARMLLEYVFTLGGLNQAINLLGQLAKELE